MMIMVYLFLFFSFPAIWRTTPSTGESATIFHCPIVSRNHPCVCVITQMVLTLAVSLVDKCCGACRKEAPTFVNLEVEEDQDSNTSAVTASSSRTTLTPEVGNQTED